jgi:hypothetical protein
VSNYTYIDKLIFESFTSVLEYPSRDDADFAAKELDGKEIRGNVVRVTVDEDVRGFYTHLHMSC